MAASKTLILAKLPDEHSRKANNKTRKGAKSNLYKSPAEINFHSCFIAPNFNCKPIENKAIGDMVATNLSKSGITGEKSAKRDITNASKQPINGGKRKIFFTKKVKFKDFVLSEEALRIVITPNEENIKNVT